MNRSRFLIAAVGAAVLLIVTGPVAGAGQRPPGSPAEFVARVHFDAHLPATASSVPDGTLNGTIRLGRAFTSITSVCFTPTFSGDLLDPSDVFAVFLDGGGGIGQGNITADPIATFTTCTGPQSTEFNATLLDGTAALEIIAIADFPVYTSASFRLARLQVTVTGTPRPCGNHRGHRPHGSNLL